MADIRKKAREIYKRIPLLPTSMFDQNLPSTLTSSTPSSEPLIYNFDGKKARKKRTDTGRRHRYPSVRAPARR